MKKKIKIILISIGVITPVVVSAIVLPIVLTKNINPKIKINKNAYEYLKDIVNNNFKQWAVNINGSNIQKYRTYLKNHLNANKNDDWTIKEQKFTFYERGFITKKGEQSGVNIELTIPGINVNPKIIGIGAHYDIGKDLFAHETKPDGTIDNISGVAMLLQLSNFFKKNKPKNTIKLLFWDAEEEGLWGSKRYVESFVKTNENKWKGYINLDSIVGGENIIGGHGFNGSRWGHEFLPSEGKNDSKNIFDYFKNKAPNSFKTSDIKIFDKNGKKREEWLDYKKGEQLAASDHVPFLKVGIEIFGLASSSLDISYRRGDINGNYYDYKGYWGHTKNKKFWEPYKVKPERWESISGNKPWTTPTAVQIRIGIKGGPKNEPSINVNGYPRYYEKYWGALYHAKFDKLSIIEKAFPGKIERQLEQVFNIIKNVKDYE